MEAANAACDMQGMRMRPKVRKVIEEVVLPSMVLQTAGLAQGMRPKGMQALPFSSCLRIVSEDIGVVAVDK